MSEYSAEKDARRFPWPRRRPRAAAAGREALAEVIERIASADRLAEQIQAAKAAALEEAADGLDQFVQETYSEDIFRRPTAEDYAAINALLEREYGYKLDGAAADCYRRAIKVQAALLRDRAAALRAES